MTKNTLELQAWALNDMGLYRANKVIVTVLEPYMESHSEQCTTCRSPEETRRWLASECGGGWLDLLHLVSARLQAEDVLLGAGFVVSGPIPGCLGPIDPAHPAIVTEDELATSMGGLTLNLLREMVVSGFSNAVCYPRGFFGILQEERAGAILADMKSYYELFVSKVQASRAPFWRKAWVRSFLKDPFCAEACGADECIHLVGSVRG